MVKIFLQLFQIARSRNNMLGSYQNTFNRNNVSNNVGRPSLYASNVAAGASTYRPRGRTPVHIPPRPVPIQGSPTLPRGIMVRQSTPVLMPSNYSAVSFIHIIFGYIAFKYEMSWVKIALRIIMKFLS